MRRINRQNVDRTVFMNEQTRILNGTAIMAFIRNTRLSLDVVNGEISDPEIREWPRTSSVFDTVFAENPSIFLFVDFFVLQNRGRFCFYCTHLQNALETII